MLLIMMYHRVGREKFANSLEMFKSHLNFLKEKYPLVLPGDPLPKNRLSVCLTFDDATYDFYHYLFPILKELKIRALLGVPVRYILETTTLQPEVRLRVPYPLMMQDEFFQNKAPFCTWEELREMIESGYIEMASHAYAHCNLTFPFVDVEREVVRSKQILEEKLPQAITSFIYPFGKVNPEVHKLVSQHYPFAFRIGSAFNKNWGDGKKPLLRVSGDNMTSPTSPLTFSKKIGYLGKTLLTLK